MASADSSEEKKRKRNLLAINRDDSDKVVKEKSNYNDRAYKAESDQRSALEKRDPANKPSPADGMAQMVMNLFTKKPKPRQGPGF